MTPEELARALVQDPELWKQHDEWVHHKCNWEQLPRYKMLEEYGSPPLEAKIATVLRARERAVWEEAANQVQKEADGFYNMTPGPSDDERVLFQRLRNVLHHAAEHCRKRAKEAG